MRVCGVGKRRCQVETPPAGFDLEKYCVVCALSSNLLIPLKKILSSSSDCAIIMGGETSSLVSWRCGILNAELDCKGVFGDGNNQQRVRHTRRRTKQIPDVFDLDIFSCNHGYTMKFDLII